MFENVHSVGFIITVTHCHHSTDQAYLLITVGGSGCIGNGVLVIGQDQEGQGWPSVNVQFVLRVCLMS